MSILRRIENGDPNAIMRFHIMYFAHPNDHDRYIRFFIDTLMKFGHATITVWTKSNPQEPLYQKDAEEFYNTLSSVKMLVFPVSRSFLETNNELKDIIIPYASDHNIRILPIMVEPGLDRAYEQIVGHHQYLSILNVDNTELPFETKLRNFMEPMMPQNPIVERVKQSFSGQIFLSYRKKNRAQAMQVVDLIHRDPILQSYSIWYDEYLIAGEKYDRHIADKLSDSLFVILVVTPDLLEEGNYVAQYEYSQAVQQGKIILPIVVDDTDKQRFLELYPTCKNYLPIEFAHEINREVRRILLHELKALPVANSGENTYHLGLAYLYGYEMECNVHRGITYLTESAMDGNIEAMNDLAEIYHDGIVVPKDMDGALFFQRRSVGRMKEIDPEHESINCGDPYYNLIRWYEELQIYDEAIHYQAEQLQIFEDMVKNNPASGSFMKGKLDGAKISYGLLLEHVGSYREAFAFLSEGIDSLIEGQVLGLQKIIWIKIWGLMAEDCTVS